MILNKTFKWRNSSDTSWKHIMISSSFLENVTSFPFAFLLWLSLHRHTQPVDLVFFSVPSAAKPNQARIANNAAKPTTPARWGLLRTVDDQFLWRHLQHRSACSTFSALWVKLWPKSDQVEVAVKTSLQTLCPVSTAGTDLQLQRSLVCTIVHTQRPSCFWQVPEFRSLRSHICPRTCQDKQEVWSMHHVSEFQTP